MAKSKVVVELENGVLVMYPKLQNGNHFSLIFMSYKIFS